MMFLYIVCCNCFVVCACVSWFPSSGCGNDADAYFVFYSTSLCVPNVNCYSPGSYYGGVLAVASGSVATEGNICNSSGSPEPSVQPSNVPVFVPSVEPTVKTSVTPISASSVQPSSSSITTGYVQRVIYIDSNCVTDAISAETFILNNCIRYGGSGVNSKLVTYDGDSSFAYIEHSDATCSTILNTNSFSNTDLNKCVDNGIDNGVQTYAKITYTASSTNPYTQPPNMVSSPAIIR